MQRKTRPSNRPKLAKEAPKGSKGAPQYGLCCQRRMSQAYLFSSQLGSIHSPKIQAQAQAWALGSLSQTGFLANRQHQENNQLREHIVNVFCTSFDDSGGKLLLSTEEKDIQVWDFVHKEMEVQLFGHQEIVTCLAHLHDPNPQKIFFSCSLDKTIMVWKGSQCIRTLTEHSDWLRCLSVSRGNTILASGCFSATVLLWDVTELQPVREFKAKGESGKKPELNAINTIKFLKGCDDLLIGTREAWLQYIDQRSQKPAWAFKAHASKLNVIDLRSDDRVMLSSGRDGLVKLWDLRMLSQGHLKELPECVQSFQDHTSKGYNIPASYIQGERYVISGSEDSHIYFYCLASNKLVKKLPVLPRVSHIVEPVPNGDFFNFIYSGLNEPQIYEVKATDFFEQVIHEETLQETKNKTHKDPKELASQASMEEIMTKHGDFMLRLFHNSNLTQSGHSGTEAITWFNLFLAIQNSDDPEAEEVLEVFNKFTREFQRLQAEQLSTEGPKKESKEGPAKRKKEDKEGSEILKDVKECRTCRQIREGKGRSLEEVAGESAQGKVIGDFLESLPF